MRARTLLLLAALVTLVPVALAGVAEGGGSSGRVPPTVVMHDRSSPETRALTVLRRWDRRRSQAWATGEPTALSRLYIRGSSTGARDADDLRRWIARGLRVTGLRQQVRSLRMAGGSPDRMVVIVTDRTVDGIAVGEARRTALPASAWATHRITLRRNGARWRVAEVRAQPAR